MGRLGVFLERYTITRSEEMEALFRFGQVARKMGHVLEYLFRPDLHRVSECDALLIRALTDPLNTSYLAARLAQMAGKPVIDDPDSIMICCDKVNMYRHLIGAEVPIPATRFLGERDLTPAVGEQLLRELGTPMVLKAPNSSFSLYVDRVGTPQEYVTIGNRYLRRADCLVAQSFIRSDFDWRIGVLAGEPLFACQYTIPKKRWKILTYGEKGRMIYGPVKGYELGEVDLKLLDTAVRAAQAIGTGLYGIDLKQYDGHYLVIEVNDNVTINAGEEDQKAPQLYERIVRHLMER